MKHPICPNCKIEMELTSPGIHVMDQQGEVQGIGDKFVCPECGLAIVHNFTQVIHAKNQRAD